MPDCVPKGKVTGVLQSYYLHSVKFHGFKKQGYFLSLSRLHSRREIDNTMWREVEQRNVKGKGSERDNCQSGEVFKK